MSASEGGRPITLIFAMVGFGLSFLALLAAIPYTAVWVFTRYGGGVTIAIAFVAGVLLLLTAFIVDAEVSSR